MIIGVTGHRDLPSDSGPLEGAVRKLLAELTSRYPSTRVVLLSSLAEGADRLAARIALELGMSLVVPLPLARSDYESDFATPESLEEFRSLLARADAAFVVTPLREAASNGGARSARSHAYANCGAYIVRKSIEIVALWDGVSDPPRGTAEVVSFQLDGIPAPYVAARRELDLSVIGPVQHVTTPRGAAGDAAAVPAAVTNTLYPRALAGKGAAQAFEKAKADIDHFNRDAVACGPPVSASRNVREYAATVANGYRTRTAGSLAAIFVLVFLSVVGFNVYATVPGRPIWLLVGYLTCVALAFCVYYASRRGDWQNRYQDCRALAEVLRVAHYWKAAGIPDSVSEIFAENHRAEVDWLSFAIRTVTEPLGPEEAATPDAGAAALQRVYDEWLEHEHHYFTEFAGRRERRRSLLAGRMVSTALLLSIVLTVSMRLLSAFDATGALDRAALFAATVLAVVAALLNSYADKRGWAEHVRRYELMATLFGRARDRVADLLARGEPDATATQRIREILRDLGEEALRENAAWLNLHRSRPIDVPTA